MREVICSIIGFGAGLWISISFIYPNDILNLTLNTITIGDILRICAGTSVIGIGGVIGAGIGEFIDATIRTSSRNDIMTDKRKLDHYDDVYVPDPSIDHCDDLYVPGPSIDAYLQAIRIDPEDAKAWDGLGLVYSDLKRYDDAIEAYLQALRIDPKEAFARYGLGLVYSDLKRYDDAIEAYLQALRINPKNSKTWFSLGIAYTQLDRDDDAIDAYRQAIHIDPEGVADLLSGNRTAALEVIRDLRRLDPAMADKLFNLIVPR